LFVFAVILSAAKDPDEFKATDTVRTSPLQIPHHSQEPQMPEGHVYILSSTTGTLYTGVTSKFDQRLFEHRNNIKSNFASKYQCNRLLLHERFTEIRAAIATEKQIKGWTRAKKLALIAQTNPEFKNLAALHSWHMLHPQQNISDQ
jgi:putative endonuclease